ncbi:hypothetical protein JTB14_016245 [Gonioctena quinquepunctata]|nr:hypothetical protein JTB14_016245 [Gonioctena quinquepunctata]
MQTWPPECLEAAPTKAPNESFSALTVVVVIELAHALWKIITAVIINQNIENIKNDHEPQKIDDEVEIFVKNKKEDVTSDEIFGKQEIFDEGETEDIISGEMHTNNEGEKKDENSNSKKNRKKQ